MSAFELSIGTWRISVGRQPPRPADLHRIYDAAWQWHPIVTLMGYHRAYARLFRRLSTDGWLEPIGLRKVLDCGIGTAGFSLALAKAVPSELEIQGVDVSPRMVERARANLRRWRPALKAEIRYGDIHQLSYSTERFDLVMGAHVIEHSHDPALALGEMVRVLRPGAPLLIATTRVHCLSTLHGFHWRYRSIGATRLSEWMAQGGITGIRRYALGPNWSLPGMCSEVLIGRKT